MYCGTYISRSKVKRHSIESKRINVLGLPFDTGKLCNLLTTPLHLPGDLIYMINFCLCFTKKTSFLASCLLFCHPSEKGSTLKGKNLLPWGANSFLLK